MSSADFIYLDNNATTQVDPAVVEVMNETNLIGYANPGSRHAAGRQARRILEEARESIAHILGASPQEVIFTSGGTESINLALFGLTYPPKGPLFVAPGEHPASSAAINTLVQQGWPKSEYKLDSQGCIEVESLESLPWSKAKLATVLWAHNETGVIQNVTPLSKLCEQHQVPLHIDGVQAVGKIDVNFHETNATALSFTAHKFHGPKGIGGLLLKSGCKLQPQHVGGFQESERRAGTEPVALIAGMAKSLEIWHADKTNRTQKLLNLQRLFESGLKKELPNIIINGADAERLPNTSNIAFPGRDGEALLVSFDLAEIACSMGSACASGSAEPAPILVAMQCSEEILKSSIRFSFSVLNTEEEIQESVQRITQIVTQLE